MKGERHQVAWAFGRTLRAVRQERGISQEELAFRVECDRTYPSLLERGLRTPTLAVYLQICEALDLHPDRLILETKERLKNLATGREVQKP